MSNSLSKSLPECADVLVLIEAVPLGCLDRDHAALLAKVVAASEGSSCSHERLPLRAAALLSEQQTLSLVKGAEYVAF